MPTKKRSQFVASFTALSVVATLLVLGVGRAAQPASGVIHTPKNSKLGVKERIVYHGGPVSPAGPDLRPPVLNGSATLLPSVQDAACTSPAATQTCDVYRLRVDIPADYWEHPVKFGYLAVTAKPDTGSTADLFVTVLDGGGGVMQRSSTGTFATKFLQVPLPKRDTYEIRTTAAGNAAKFTTTIEFVLAKDEEVVPNVTQSRSIRFSAQTLVDPQAWGAEPGMNFDPSGGNRVFVDWPWVPGYGSVLNRSSDGGKTFRRLVNASCAIRQKPNCLGGLGGDSETAITKKGRIYFTDQEEVASQGAAISNDHGNTFPVTSDSPLTTLPQSDRMYLATRGEDEAYMFFGGNLGVEMVKTADGGKTWTHDNKFVASGAEAHTVIDETGGPNDGTIFNLTRSPLQMAVSKDKGATFTVYPVIPEGFGHVPSSFVPGFTMDTAGNMYVSFWTNDTGDLYMTTSLASDPRNKKEPGSTWSPPVRISGAPVRTAVFSAIAAGSPGRIAVAYYGADGSGLPDSLTDGQAWYVHANFSMNALCQWKKQCGKVKAPAFEDALVSHRPNHYGQVCTSGLTCTTTGVDRSLLDFLDIGVTKDGTIGVVWSDNNRAGPIKALEPDVVFARLESGPNLFANKPAKRIAAATRSITDSAADATYPYSGETIGPNHPKADLRSVSATATPTSVNLNIDLADAKDLGALATQLGAQRTVYLTRWWQGRETYFAAYEVLSDGTTRAFWGQLSHTDGFLLGRRYYAAAYTADGMATAKISGKRLTIEIPRSAIGNPKKGDTLFGINTFVLSGYREGATQAPTLLSTLDASPPFDFLIGR